MRQLTCIAPGTVEWREVPEPRLEGDGEALVRPLAVARCDIDPFLTAGLFPPRGPFALGHECVAEIVALGDAVRGLAVGQRVVVAFQVSCGACRSCGAGHTANCDRYPVLSDYGMQPLSGVEYGGMLADVARVPHAEAMLAPVPAGLDSVALGSVSDNVLDGYRAVAPHLADFPGADVLIVSHGLKSVPLYAAQTAVALGAARVDYASDDAEVLASAERLGAHPIRTDFEKPERRYPIVVDAGLTPSGLRYAIRATAPEGTLQSVSFYVGGDMAMPLGRLYTLGIRFFVGRAHSAALLPEVMSLIQQRRLRPEEVTTRVVDWEEAAVAYLEPAIKLVVRRS
ncbi:MAG TPA: alcohol dehydrogenase catalytic domain-containing protein [Candidatus Eisenbacteria bacterium]|nr:alcohol dehydrogenase catalytic domain-containing protein [Candidatus Eisenbacteria bacterium]